MNWVFYHGWGFSKECWEEWAALLPKNHTAQFFDRGYFGEPNIPTLTQSIVIAHSYGLHQIQDFTHIKKLVIIGGFVQIHKYNYLKWLLKTLKTAPTTALEKFYLDCGLEKKIVGSLNTPLLIKDLLALNKHELDLSALLQIPEVLLLHGTADQIAPLEKALELHRLLPNSRLVTFESTHALPFVKAQECFNRVAYVFANL